MKIKTCSAYMVLEVRKNKCALVEIGTRYNRKGEPAGWFVEVKSLDLNPPRVVLFKSRTWAAAYRQALREAEKFYTIKKNKVAKKWRSKTS